MGEELERAVLELARHKNICNNTVAGIAYGLSVSKDDVIEVLKRHRITLFDPPLSDYQSFFRGPR